MVNVRCIGVLVLGVMSSTSMSEATESDRPTVRVHIVNHADLRPSVLHSAGNELARIYESAGIRVVWSVTPEHQGCVPFVTVHALLMSLSMEDRFAASAGVGSHVLGLALRETRRVYLFWSRIDAYLPGKGVATGDALGVVIAHELGHVLLPPDAHSATGIMHEHYLVRRSYGQRFTTEQATAMRALLAGANTRPQTLDAQP